MRISSYTHNYLRQLLLFMASEGKMIVDAEKKELVFVEIIFDIKKVSFSVLTLTGPECNLHFSGWQKASFKDPFQNLSNSLQMVQFVYSDHLHNSHPFGLLFLWKQDQLDFPSHWKTKKKSLIHFLLSPVMVLYSDIPQLQYELLKKVLCLHCSMSQLFKF